MVSRENRAELRIMRSVTILGNGGSAEPDFLNKSRNLGDRAFGTRGLTRVTVRPPHVSEPVNEYAGEPVAKVYDAANLRMAYVWRVATGDSNAGRKFFKAKQDLDRGVGKSQKGKSANAIEKKSLYERLAEASQEFELPPSTEFIIVCNSIYVHRSQLLHPGSDIFCLVPDQGSEENLTIMREQQVAEEAVADVSGYVYRQVNVMPGAMVPFMRIPSSVSADARDKFLHMLMPDNRALNVRLRLGPVALSINNE